MGFDCSIKTFLILLRAGLWEKKARLNQFEKIDYHKIYRLAEEQSVLGLVTAGLEHIIDINAPKDIVLQFAGQALQLERRNLAMNSFVSEVVETMRSNDIYTLLVKGQGVAQCYERPLWRSTGDIDFYLSESNYEKAKAFLSSLAEQVEDEDKCRLHLGLTIDGWLVELHGTMHTNISRRMNIVADEVHHDIFYGGNVRSWNNGGIQVFLPSPNNDVIIVFNHFINHFYGEGIGLRQVCDWCRLLWTYKSEINVKLLETRIRKAGLMSEWKAFAALAVDWLGMPVEAMPFYDEKKKYTKKANRIAELIIETGSFGRNKDYSYRQNGSKWRVNVQTFFTRMREYGRLATIFPVNASMFFVNYVFNRIKAVIQ